jgi:hypothetical protein
MFEELGRLGHGVSYGTLYPALHRMEEDGLLEWEDRVEGGRVRKSRGRTPARESGVPPPQLPRLAASEAPRFRPERSFARTAT